MANSIADLMVRIGADTSELRKGLQKASSDLSSMAQRAQAAFKTIVIPTAAVTGAIALTSKLAAMGKQAIDTAGALQDQSRALGVTAEFLQEQRLLADAAGVSAQAYDVALMKLNKNIGQAALGQGKFEKTLDAAGIKLRDGEGHIKSVATVYGELSEKIRAGSISQAESIAIAASAFGKEGGKMVEVLRMTADEQKRVIETARQYGAILSNEVVAAADEYGDKLALIEKGTQALAAQSASLLIPLTMKWASMKSEIAGVTAELARAAGLIDDNATFQQRRLADVERMLANSRAKQKDNADAGIVDNVLDVGTEQLVKQREKLLALLAESKRAAADAAAAIAPTSQDVTAEHSAALTAALEDAQEDTAKTESMLFELFDGIKKKQAEVATAAAANVTATEQMLTALFEGIREKQNEADTQTEQVISDTLAGIRETTKARMEELHQRYADEGTLEQERYLRELDALKEALELKAVTEGEAQRRREDALRQHEAKMGAIAAGEKKRREDGEEAEWIKKGRSVTSGMARITSMIATNNKKAFDLNKAAAISEAAVDMYAGISKGVRLGFPAGIPAVAWATAQGLASIAAIKSTKFQGGGGGTTPSAAGGSTVNGNPVASAAPGNDQRLVVEGISADSLFTGSAVRNLAQRLLDYQRDGGKVVLS